MVRVTIEQLELILAKAKEYHNSHQLETLPAIEFEQANTSYTVNAYMPKSREFDRIPVYTDDTNNDLAKKFINHDNLIAQNMEV